MIATASTSPSSASLWGEISVVEIGLFLAGLMITLILLGVFLWIAFRPAKRSEGGRSAIDEGR